ncbi:sulfur-oxidizing protein SoxY [Methylobacterium sp. BE186]|uniref:quinoprotein dehydrogenase-associated SoxYZ-like carrier n=1 Tax=Methylobacterium sp. BE186 TaxID=2817715 RepID=UPI00285AA601|nr:quinoprotein dehydrogenase-associated SoxYZ-like carrier [Methylobacterium sp. BE186]MDR7038522.1 sulfur-oxidizing protein SoxY [Methylobacterium sp. BE186]
MPASPLVPNASTIRDPLDSPLWPSLTERHLGGRPALFDDRVAVMLPPVTEDQTQVPVTVDARPLGAVDELLVIADLNPFPLTLRLRPGAAQPFVGLRMKIEQGTPIRAAARCGDLWHVGGRYLDAAGGGCSVPPVIEKAVDWKNLGALRARAWREEEGVRLRLRMTHPMDNGMIANVPLFIVETLRVSDASGRLLAEVSLSEAVADNPTLTLILDRTGSDALILAARNSAGSDFRARLPIPAPSPAARAGGQPESP